MWRRSLGNKQWMTIHILTNILRSKDNQAMKFDQSIEYKMRNIFYTQNVVKNSSQILFWKSKLRISSDQKSTCLFVSSPLVFTLCKSFLKREKNSETILLATFSKWFLKKNILLVMFITWQNFIVWVPLLREIFGIMCIVIVC